MSNRDLIAKETKLLKLEVTDKQRCADACRFVWRTDHARRLAHRAQKNDCAVGQHGKFLRGLKNFADIRRNFHEVAATCRRLIALTSAKIFCSSSVIRLKLSFTAAWALDPVVFSVMTVPIAISLRSHVVTPHSPMEAVVIKIINDKNFLIRPNLFIHRYKFSVDIVFQEVSC